MASQQPGVSPEALSASGRNSEKLSLPTLQSKMKSDPEEYESELVLVHNQFKSSLELFRQQAALNFTSISGIRQRPRRGQRPRRPSHAIGTRHPLLPSAPRRFPQPTHRFPRLLRQIATVGAKVLQSRKH
ncbi:hypothetical protein SLA2020_425110 [Shorea laevis]